MERLVLLAMVLGPLIKLMATHLDMSSKEWSERQEAGLLYTGAAATTILGGRLWPVLVCAVGAIYDECMAEIAALNDADKYAWLPNFLLTLELQNWVCLSISRMGACVHQLVIVESRKMPMRLFLLLTDTAIGASFLQLCPSLLDTYAASYISRLR